jgi:hypothetical protein
MGLDAIVPKHIESEEDFRVVIIELLDGVLRVLGVKMVVHGWAYHEDTGNYVFKLRRAG